MKKVKQILLTVGVILITSSLMAQPTFEWANSGGSTNAESGTGVAFDQNGNSFFALYISVSPSLVETVIEKRDPAGVLLWTKTLGGATDVQSQNLTTDASGNVYICGKFEGTIDFDPGAGTDNHTSLGSGDAFIMKLDASGNFQWANTFGSNDDEDCRDVEIDNNGDVIITGLYMNTVDFNSGVGVFNMTAVANRDIYIKKLDNLGNFIWAKSVGGTGYNTGISVAVNSTNDVIVTGGFQAVVDFDPGIGVFNLTGSGTFEIFVLKLDVNGDFVWANAMGSTSTDLGLSVAVSSNDKIHVTGRFTGTVDFDPGVGVQNITSIGSFDCFILKLNDDGTLNWVQTIGGVGGYAAGEGIAVDDMGSVYVSGYFGSTVDFDPGVGTYNLVSLSEDIFIFKIDSAGSFEWAMNGGSAVAGDAVGVAVDPAYNVAITGGFGGTIDVDPSASIFNLVSNGSYDYFELYLSQCIATAGTDVQTACGSYIWIDNNTYTVNNTTATHTLVGGNMNGCDSIVTLNLTINNETAGTDVQTACGTYTWIDNNTYTASNTTATHTLIGGNMNGCDSVVTLNLTINNADTSVTKASPMLTADATGAMYRWLDCNNAYAVIAGATNQSFTPAVNGSYAVEVTENGCTDTSSCYSITGIGIRENILDDLISVYPNPTNGLFTIEWLNNKNQTVDLSVVSLTGKIIIQLLFEEKIEIDLSKEAKGVYYLQFTNANTTTVKKLVLQ